MLDHINDDRTGWCPVIWHDRMDHTISLVVILAGTNEIAMMEDTSKNVARSILRTIIDLHESAIECHGEDDGERSIKKLNRRLSSLQRSNSLRQSLLTRAAVRDSIFLLSKPLHAIWTPKMVKDSLYNAYSRVSRRPRFEPSVLMNVISRVSMALLFTKNGIK